MQVDERAQLAALRGRLLVEQGQHRRLAQISSPAPAVELQALVVIEVGEIDPSFSGALLAAFATARGRRFGSVDEHRPLFISVADRVPALVLEVDVYDPACRLHFVNLGAHLLARYLDGHGRAWEFQRLPERVEAWHHAEWRCRVRLWTFADIKWLRGADRPAAQIGDFRDQRALAIRQRGRRLE